MKLCYVDLPWCYFTTQPLDKQWGDNWNDAPYECNAGEPYKPTRSGEKWEIKKIAIDGILFLEPPAEQRNFQYSVEDINNGKVAWLVEPYIEISIMAGCSLEEFIKIIKENGGEIYEERR